MSQARYEKTKRVLQWRQSDVHIILDEVNKFHNLAAIVRTCDATGIENVYAVETAHCHLKAFRRSSAGSNKWVNVHAFDNRDELLQSCCDQSTQFIAAHHKGSMDFRMVDYTRPTTIVLGAERKGLSAKLLQKCQLVTIPMYGMTTSLNVSVAAAVILYELERQRKNAKMYRTDQTVNRNVLFEWLQPKLARLCRENGWSYPEINENGDLIEPAEWLRNQTRHRR